MSCYSNELYDLNLSSQSDISLYASSSSEEQSSIIYNIVKDDIFLTRLKKISWEKYDINKSSKNSSMKQQIIKLLEDNCLKEVLVNSIVKLYERNIALNMYVSPEDKSLVYARRSNDEKDQYVREARISWGNNIIEELVAISKEMNRDLVIKRPIGSKSLLLEVNDIQAPPGHIRFLFDSEDLFETGNFLYN